MGSYSEKLLWQTGVQLLSVSNRLENVFREYGVLNPRFTVYGDGGDVPFAILSGNDTTGMAQSLLHRSRVEAYHHARLAGELVGVDTEGRPYRYSNEALKAEFGDFCPGIIE